MTYREQYIYHSARAGDLDCPYGVGDRITFRANTRWSSAKATRVVNGYYLGQPTVRYGGCPNFIVRLEEIEA